MNAITEIKYYMHPQTGSVDTEENWMDTYRECEEERKKYENYEEYENVPEWDGESLTDLCEVRKDENGDWVEVE